MLSLCTTSCILLYPDNFCSVVLYNFDQMVFKVWSQQDFPTVILQKKLKCWYMVRALLVSFGIGGISLK